MRNVNGVGLVLVVLGSWWLARDFGLIPLGFGDLVREYWPLLLMLMGVWQLLAGSQKGGMFWIVVGGVFQLAHVFDVNAWGLFWPIVLIWLGSSMIFKEEKFNRESGQVEMTGSLKRQVMFSGLDLKVKSEDFDGGKVECFFGAVKLDLRDAKVVDGAVLQVTAAFAGIEVLVPQKAIVEVRGTSVFGGFTNKATTRADKKLPKIIIKGEAIFGGVEVKE